MTYEFQPDSILIHLEHYKRLVEEIIRLKSELICKDLQVQVMKDALKVRQERD